MQENEFEKKVRGLMDDLEISPSAPVWDYVEKRIPKSNRRRRFIAFFLLLAGFAVCGYFFYHKFADDSTIDKTVATGTVPKAATTGKSSDDGSANNNGSITNSSTTAHITTGNKKTTPVLKDKEQPLQTALKNAAISALQIKKENENNFTTTNATITGTNKETPVTADEPAIAAIQPDANTGVTNKEPAGDNSRLDTIQNIVIREPDTTAATALETNDTTPPIKPAKQQTDKSGKKLQWGISGFYGRSDVVENIGSITAEKSYSWDGSLNAGPGSNRNDSILYEDQSKNVKARSAFSLGINVRKPLSSRSSITTGIAFMHMKTQIQTGIAKDSSAVFYYNNSQSATYLQNFYRPGNASSQINTYSLLQVPFLYSYQLNKNKKLPFIIDAGLSFTRVLSSNALVYDSYNLAYYKNDALINKTQVHLLGGLNTSLTFRNKSNLIIGPQFQYGLTGVIKNNSSSQHFFTWGLQARYFIKK